MAINPQTAALNPVALIAAQQKRTAFVPTVGTGDKPSYLIVQFPGETMRVPVEKVINDDTVIVRVASPPISRMHSFRFDELVCVRRRLIPREFWEAQTERDFMAEQKRLSDAAKAAAKPAPQKAEPATPPEPAKRKVAPAKKPAAAPAKKKATKAPAKAPAKRKAKT